MFSSFKIYNASLHQMEDKDKLLINTINAYSYNLACKDLLFRQSLTEGELLIPDGIGIVLANFLLTGKWVKKIAGADLFFHEMERLNKSGGKCFFLGSSDAVLRQIMQNAALDYPNISVMTYSPPFKIEFSEADNQKMLERINGFQPDVLFVGMTAPKQEKWAYKHFDKLRVGHIGCIGAVFDFYAGTVKRAPRWMIKIGMEWLYRLIREPKRMWRRYLIGNVLFGYNILKYEILGLKNKQSK